MNPNLYILKNDFKPVYRVLQYNVDQAMREEAVEATKWSNRFPRIKKLIDEVDADIVCLQEMRKLPNTITVNEFLASFKQYLFVVEYRNSSLLSFGQAILYKPEKLYPVKTTKYWLSDTPHKLSDTWANKAGGTTGFGYIVMGVKFYPVSEEKVIHGSKPLWVFNTHFGLEEELKTKSCHKLRRIVESTVTCEDSEGNDEFIVCGDFNFFPDKDGNNQRSILTSKWKDLGQSALTLSGKKVEGTFVGYEHDNFKADLKNMVSRLDHVFSSTNVKGVNATLYTKTMLDKEPEELTTRDYPSDHLPLVVTIEIN